MESDDEEEGEEFPVEIDKQNLNYVTGLVFLARSKRKLS